MAELQILGQVLNTTDIVDKFSLFCRFSFQAGPNWTLISGHSEGQTVTAKADYSGTVIWAHPLDALYITKGIQGWPKINFQVSCLDTIGRSWVVGYGYCSLPAAPGYHNIKVPCWTPVANTLIDRIRQYFLGGSPQLIQTDIINIGTNRFKLKTQSKGYINLQLNLIFRNFTQFGVEYK